MSTGNTRRRDRLHQRGFSLLEMVVAVAILAMTLSAMYRVAGGATRSVGMDQEMAYGVELARSLLALHSIVPNTGLNMEGETEGGYRWEVVASPVLLPEEAPLREGQLQDMTVAVRWAAGERERSFVLHSVVAGVVEEE